MTDDQDLTVLYALDALDDVERARFERRLRDDPRLQDEVDRARADAAQLAQTAAPVAPPAQLREELMRDVAATPQEAVPDRQLSDPGDVPAHSTARTSTRGPWLGRGRLAVAGAAAALVMATGALVVTQPWADDQQPAPVTAQSVLGAKDASTHTAAAAVPVAVVTSRADHRAVLTAQRMPPAPAGKVHQMWFLDQHQKARSAGVMHGPGPWLLDGSSAGAAAVAVTIEPAGGSRQPTSDPVAAISLG